MKVSIVPNQAIQRTYLVTINDQNCTEHVT